MLTKLTDFLKTAEYTVDLRLSEDEWTLSLPEKKEFIVIPPQTIKYNIEQILTHIDFYCITYYIVANTITQCNKINYAPSLINYYDENNVLITENDAIYYYEDNLTPNDMNKLNILTVCFDKIIGGGLTNDVMNKAIKYGVSKDLLILYNIVRRDS